MFKAALDTEYRPSPGSGVIPAMELILITEPPPLAFIIGSSQFPQFKWRFHIHIHDFIKSPGFRVHHRTKYRIAGSVVNQNNSAKNFNGFSINILQASASPVLPAMPMCLRLNGCSNFIQFFLFLGQLPPLHRSSTMCNSLLQFPYLRLLLRLLFLPD